MHQFPIGSYVQLSAAALEVCHASLRTPTVFRMCGVTDPQKERDGWLAVEILTGERAYKSILVRPEQIEPAKPCYACKHATPMNDRDKVRCTMVGGANGRLTNSALSCGLWLDRRAP
jgi:hypothetical protein